MIYNIYKKRGETPLQCIEKFKEAKIEKFGDYYNEKMTYMGRLDPLAEGVLLVGSGKDTSQKRREEFFGLDKEYEFTILFGFATDTYDVMGRILKVDKVENLSEMDLIKIAKIYEGEREQKYPEYSSKIIAKRRTSSSPLLEQEGESTSFPSPDQGEGRVGFSKKITIHKLLFHKLETLSSKQLFGRILADISKVDGDFRQMEILEDWKKILIDSKTPFSLEKSPYSMRSNIGPGVEHYIAKFSAHVSSGTYIRSLVNDIDNTLGCGATTLSIKRTRVGTYKIEDSIK